MKNQEQVLLALLLLALTSMAAVAGGMNVAEPFFEEHPEEEEVPVDGEIPEMPEGESFVGNSPGAQMVSTDLEDVEKAEAEAEKFVQHNAMPQMNNAMPELPAAEDVEGFTGGMYAGF